MSITADFFLPIGVTGLTIPPVLEGGNPGAPAVVAAWPLRFTVSYECRCCSEISNQLMSTSVTRLRGLLAAVFIAAAASAARADDAVATYAFTRGWATFGLPLPQGAARDAVQVGQLPTQTDVKVRWPDGSIRLPWYP